MTDSPPLERMQLIADYRTAVKFLKKSGRQAISYGCFCFLLGMLNFDQSILHYVYLGICATEVLIGLRNRLAPSAAGILLDLFLLALLGIWNIGVQVLVLEMGGQPSWFVALLGLFMIFAAAKRVSHYNRVRDAFREPPSESQLAWFDEVIDEIRNAKADETDDMIQFTTGFTWKGKRLGDVLIVVDQLDSENLVVDPGDTGFTDRGKVLIGKGRNGALRLGKRTFGLVTISPEMLLVLMNWQADSHFPKDPTPTEE